LENGGNRGMRTEIIKKSGGIADIKYRTIGKERCA